MAYSIFFDESGKLDREQTYSYYGAFGCDDTTKKQLNEGIQNIYRYFNKKSEFHFTEYKNDRNVNSALAALHYFTSLQIPINIFIINNEVALDLANKRNISTYDLRKLFYVKIPERLFYGLTREKSFSYEAVNITLDHSPEYGKMKVYSKIKEQMNAHSLYRHRSYQVHDVKSKHSHHSIELQMVDMFLGLVVYIIEQSYKTNSNKDIVKSELIYRYLDIDGNLQKFQDLITIYRWEHEAQKIEKLPMSKFVSEFIQHKTKFDVIQLQNIFQSRMQNPDATVKELREINGFTSNMAQLFFSYLRQLDGKHRNELFYTIYANIFP